MISELTEDTRTKVRKHAMHIVAVLALLGVLAPLGRLIASGVKSGFVFNAAVGTQGGNSIERHLTSFQA